MKIFKTKKDLQQLPKNDPTYKILKQCLKRSGHLEGYFVLIERGDVMIDLPEVDADLRDLSFDGIFKTAGHYHAVYLTNNSFGLEFIIPDREWLAASIKKNLIGNITN